jgi:hypothetical protein
VGIDIEAKVNISVNFSGAKNPPSIKKIVEKAKNTIKDMNIPYFRVFISLYRSPTNPIIIGNRMNIISSKFILVILRNGIS